MTLQFGDVTGNIWNPRFTIMHIKVISAVDPVANGLTKTEWSDIVKGAASQWEKSGVVAFTHQFNELASPDYVPGSVVLKTQDAPGEPDEWAGFTNPFVSWKDSLTTGALIWIDPNAFTSGVDLKYILAHELGHVLGFKHTLNPDSVMAYQTVSGRSAVVTDTDLELVRELYA